MKTFLCLISLMSLIHCADVTTPVWPDQFTQTFTEKLTYPIIGTGVTSGVFYYNWTTKQYRIDRVNGKWDRYCGSVYKFRNTPCSHFVNEGKRFLYFPEMNDCCMCCTDKGGCGILKPNWLDGSEYVGEQTSEDGTTQYQVFNQKGLQDNLAYFDKATGIMARIDQQPNDDQTYSVSSFNPQFDQKVLELPTICQANKKCSMFSVCGALNMVQANIV